MVLIYLSSTKIRGKTAVAVRVNVFRNTQSAVKTQILEGCTEQLAKMLMLRETLKALPWTQESVTVFLNDDPFVLENEDGGKRWKEILQLQKRFALVVCYKDKGTLSNYLQEKLKRDLSEKGVTS